MNIPEHLGGKLWPACGTTTVDAGEREGRGEYKNLIDFHKGYHDQFIHVLCMSL